MCIFPLCIFVGDSGSYQRLHCSDLLWHGNIADGPVVSGSRMSWIPYSLCSSVVVSVFFIQTYNIACYPWFVCPSCIRLWICFGLWSFFCLFVLSLSFMLSNYQMQTFLRSTLFKEVNLSFNFLILLVASSLSTVEALKSVHRRNSPNNMVLSSCVLKGRRWNLAWFN